MNYKPLKRIFKFSIGSILLLIVFLLLFLFVGLKMPFVQKKLGNIATSYLSKKFESKVEVESVGIYLFDKVALKGVYVEDLANDTLVNFKDLSIDIDLKKLLKQKVEADKIVLNDATVKIDQNEDLVFNFQFIIDAFAPKEKKDDLPVVVYFHGTQIDKERKIKIGGEMAICTGLATDGYAALYVDYVGIGKGEGFHLYQNSVNI